MDPWTAKEELSFLANDVLPAGRARKRLARWDSKAKIAHGKSRVLSVRLGKIEARAAAVDPKTLRGRWLARRGAALKKKAQKQHARYMKLKGAGKGAGGALMGFRRAKAQTASKAFGLKGVAVFLGGALAGISLLMLVPALIGAISAAGSSADSGGTGTLEGNEMIVATYLREKGLNATGIAAIIGNMVQESGVNPSSLNGSSGAFGLCQWLGGRLQNLKSLCSSRGKPATDMQCQLDHLWNELTYVSSGGWSLTSDWDEFQSLSNAGSLEQAVELFCRHFERPGEGEMNLARRISEARRALDAINSSSTGGSGQEFQASSAQQQAIVNACKATPSPGSGLCAMWVSQVYRAAGFPYPSGNACDMYWTYCKSSDRNQLKVGMIVAVPSWTGTAAGRTYGHVAIYIGDGQVMDNIGSIRTTSLDSWISTYGDTYPVRWGFAATVAAN